MTTYKAQLFLYPDDARALVQHCHRNGLPLPLWALEWDGETAVDLNEWEEWEIK